MVVVIPAEAIGTRFALVKVEASPVSGFSNVRRPAAAARGSLVSTYP
jgi:hypothetical protein